jgi:tRNA (guanine37-N1)-methyltransferase
MKIEILTIFPDYFLSPLAESLLGKAISAGRLEVIVTDLRVFAEGRHRKVDDEPYGGGAGMVMMAPVLAAAIEARRGAAGLPRAWTVLLSPAARRLDQRVVEELAARERILLVCGRYEGIDERAREIGLFDEEISLGDFILPGGEAAALAVTEAISRLVPGVVGSAESVEKESFARDRLDYPHYTRPREFRGLAVPEPLVSGDHARILRWRRARALARTREHRPDLLERRPEEPGEGEE